MIYVHFVTFAEQRLREAWRAVLLAGDNLLDMDAQYRERQAYLHRAHLLVRIRQSTLVVELIALYAIKLVRDLWMSRIQS